MEKEKALEVFRASHSLGALGKIYSKFCLQNGELGPERDLIRDPIRINMRDGAIAIPKRRLIDRWVEKFGEDISRSVYVIQKWKVGCQAIILARDSTVVNRILERMNQAIINQEHLRVPGMEKENREKLLCDFSNFRQELQADIEREKEAKEREKAMQNPLFKELLELLERVEKSHQELIDIKTDIDGCIKEMKESFTETERYLGHTKKTKIGITWDPRDSGKIDLSYYDRNEEFEKTVEKPERWRSRKIQKKPKPKISMGNKKLIDGLFSDLNVKRERIFGLPRNDIREYTSEYPRSRNGKEDNPELEESSIEEREDFEMENEYE